MYTRSWMSLLIIFIMAMITGCGGGSSSTNADSTSLTKTVSGVAATGSAIVGTVYLKDSSSPAREISTPIGADGSYSFDVSSLTAPFVLKAVGTANGQNYTLYSLAGTPGIANINPLSHLAVVRANNGVDPALLYANLTPVQAQTIKAALLTVIPQIQALLQQVLSQYGVTTTNFISDAYIVNHTGLDLLFDLVAIVVNNGNVTLTNKSSGSAILTTTLSGSTLSGQVVATNIPTLTSQAIGMVYAYSTSNGIVSGGTATLRAIVIGTANQAVTWSVVESGGGSITNAGIYTAPTTAGTYHLKATSSADNTKSGIASVIVSASGGTTNNIGSVWKTDSTVSPSVTIIIGSFLSSNGTDKYYKGSIQSTALINGGVSITNRDVSNYIMTYTYFDSTSMLIDADDGNCIIGIIPSSDLLSSTSNTVSAFIGIMNSTTYIYSGMATLIKQ